MSGKHHILWGLAVTAILLLVGCNLPGAAPEPTEVAVASNITINLDPDITEVSTDQEVTIVPQMEPRQSGITFRWAITGAGGTLSGDTGPATIYTAVNPGTDSVTVEAVIGEGDDAIVIASETVSFRVITPEPPPTETPTPTDMPTATRPSTTSDTLAQLEDVFSQINEGQEFDFSWSESPIHKQFNRECARSGEYGLEIEYDHTEENYIGWGVHWSNSDIGHFDATEFTTLVFSVKRIAGNGTFQIGLKDTDAWEVKLDSSTLNLGNIDNWVEVSIPLTSFVKGAQSIAVNTNSIENLNFGFNDDLGSLTICIDEIRFE